MPLTTTPPLPHRQHHKHGPECLLALPLGPYALLLILRDWGAAIEKGLAERNKYYTRKYSGTASENGWGRNRWSCRVYSRRWKRTRRARPAVAVAAVRRTPMPRRRSPPPRMSWRRHRVLLLRRLSAAASRAAATTNREAKRGMNTHRQNRKAGEEMQSQIVVCMYVPFYHPVVFGATFLHRHCESWPTTTKVEFMVVA